jgi:DNA-binding transcriptional regulator YdaS (Cro superfamily)
MDMSATPKVRKKRRKKRAPKRHRPDEKTALDRACDLFPSQNRFAAAIGVGKTTIPFWRYRSRKGVPGEYCERIEAATGGRITKDQLRPDLFKPLPTTAAANAERAQGIGRRVAEILARKGR